MGILDLYKEEGLKIGREEGIKVGIKEGKKEGIKEGLIITARKMLKKGLTLEEVANFVDLPKEEILKIKESLDKESK